MNSILLVVLKIFQNQSASSLSCNHCADCCILSQQNAVCWLEPSAPPACTGNQNAGKDERLPAVVFVSKHPIELNCSFATVSAYGAGSEE